MEDIYSDLRLTPPSKRCSVLQKGEDTNKEIQNNEYGKENGVTIAKGVKEVFFYSLTPTSTAFLGFFEDTTL